MRYLTYQWLLACCLTLCVTLIQTPIALAELECDTPDLRPTESIIARNHNLALQANLRCLREDPFFDTLLTKLRDENWQICTGEPKYGDGYNKTIPGDKKTIYWDHDDYQTILQNVSPNSHNNVQRIPIASLAHEVCHAFKFAATGKNDPSPDLCSGLPKKAEFAVGCENLIRMKTETILQDGNACFYGEDPNVPLDQQNQLRRILGAENELLCLGCGDGILDPDEGEECDPGDGVPEEDDELSRLPVDFMCPGQCNDQCKCNPCPTDPCARFADNCDGTITDRLMGLMWEKKDNAGGLHDVDNFYPWDVATTTWINAVNSENDGEGFAGYTDWRIPSVERRGNPAELETIITDFCLWPEQTEENSNMCTFPFPWGCSEQPCYDPIWETECPEGCTTTECSCIAGAALSCGPNCRSTDNNYWSSVLFESGGTVPYTAEFGWGTINHNTGIASSVHVRAVRGPVDVGIWPPDSCLP